MPAKGIRRIGVIFGIGIVAGCVNTQSYEVFSTDKIGGSKEVAVSGPRFPWVVEIEKRLRAEGFAVKRWTSQHRTTELSGPGEFRSYNEASTRVILVLDGYAPNTPMTRCLGGGYEFDFIQAELIDVKKNETISSYNNSGYSENCPPVSGTIFADIAAMVVSAF